MPRKESEAAPEGSGPVPQQEEFGSGQPTLADIELYRMFKEVYEEVWDRKMQKFTQNLRSMNQRVARLLHLLQSECRL